VVNVTSVCVHGGHYDLSLYSASKAAIALATKNYAGYARPFNVRANCVQPGWMATDQEIIARAKDLNDPDWLSVADASQDRGRILRPAQCANLCLFLLSDLATMITGQAIDIGIPPMVGASNATSAANPWTEERLPSVSQIKAQVHPESARVACTGLEAVELVVPNLDEAKHFFETVFGTKCVMEGSDPARDGWYTIKRHDILTGLPKRTWAQLEFPGSGTGVKLVEYPEAKYDIPKNSDIGGFHLGFFCA